jgi:hypothetical protein
MRTPRKPDRRVRPAAEGLEPRQLLDAKTRLVNGTPISDTQLRRLTVQLANTYSNGQRVPVSDRRISYTTPEGKTAIVTLYGKGSLKGTTVTDGVLNLVYNLTDTSSQILGTVKGGGVAPLSGIRDADSIPGSPATTGVNPVSSIKLHSFALVPGGFVNLTGGIGELDLYSLGRGSEVHVAFTPNTSSGSNGSTGSTGNTGASGGTFTSVGGTTTIVGGTTTTVGNTTTNVGGTTTVSSGASSTGGASGASGGSGVTTLPPPPAGIVMSVVRVDAGPLPAPPLQNPEVYAVDPVAHDLIRFDTGSGNPDLVIPLPPLQTSDPAVGLGANNGLKAVLVGDNQIVYAFDAVTGAPLGQFSTADLAGAGFTRVDGIGASDTSTMLVQSGGPAILIDLPASIAQGKAVPTSKAFTPARDLTLIGGATGLPGTNTLYATAAAHFDPAQPDKLQLGVIAMTPGNSSLSEASRTAFPGPINISSDDLTDPAAGFGSIDNALARLTGYADGKNTVTVYNVSTLATEDTLTLNYPGQLHGLSESFYPALRDAALVDVQGVLKTFAAQSATGLVINGRSTVNLVGIYNAADTAIIGQPLTHVAIPHRQNVALISTARGVDGKVTRNGVTVEKSIPTLGVVALP